MFLKLNLTVLKRCKIQRITLDGRVLSSDSLRSFVPKVIQLLENICISLKKGMTGLLLLTKVR